jgi:hypothetical protein
MSDSPVPRENKSKPTSGVRRVSNKRPNPTDPATPPAKPPVSSESTSQESKNRSNRRHRNKPKSSPKETETPLVSSDSSSTPDPAAPSPSPETPQSQPTPGGRLKLNPEDLSKKAWKIFLAEVSEEGISLISDNDARDFSRRCFRLAEIFLEEQKRRI